MEPLASQKCVPCEGGVDPLDPAEIDELLSEVPGWNVIQEDGESRLIRAYKFPDFKSAMAFCVKVGEEAERVGHHPVMTVTWGKATIKWWTHAIGGLHRNDFIMASVTDIMASQSGD